MVHCFQHYNALVNPHPIQLFVTNTQSLSLSWLKSLEKKIFFPTTMGYLLLMITTIL